MPGLQREGVVRLNPQLSNAQILDREEAHLGRKCLLVDSADLGESVTVVLYKPSPISGDYATVNGKALQELRVVAYSGERQLFSAIAESWWA